MGDTSCPPKTAHDAVLHTETEVTVDSSFMGYSGLNSTRIINIVGGDSVVSETINRTDLSVIAIQPLSLSHHLLVEAVCRK